MRLNSLPGHYQSPLPSISVLANAALFNVSWLAIVLTQSSLIAPLVVALHMVVHFSFLGRGAAEARLIVLVTLLGLVLDQLLFLTGLFTRPDGSIFAPIWLSCLWPVLATTLMHAFRSLQPHPFLAGIIGAAGGTLSYLAGVRLTDIAFASDLWGPLSIALIWAFLFPFLLLGANLAESSDKNGNNI